MDELYREELYKELSTFARANRKALRSAEQWLDEFDRGDFMAAWETAKNEVPTVDWQKIVYIAWWATDKKLYECKFEFIEKADLRKWCEEGQVYFLCDLMSSGRTATNEYSSFYLIRNALEEGREAVANKKNNKDPFAIKAKDCSHNEDFTTVIWYGTEYSFNKTQARCIKYLWKNNSASENSIGEMLDSAACHGYRLRDTFRNRTGYHCAWGKMIIRAGKGCFKLNKPQS